MSNEFGPQHPVSQQVHADKYRGKHESFVEAADRFVDTLADDETHAEKLRPIIREQRFMGAGRTQAAVGSSRNVTAFNCFVSGTIEDSMESIMQRLTEAAETMRRGGGCGFDFSTLRPSGDIIVSLESTASGPISFMDIWNAMCSTIMSAGHRRGAMMGVMRVDHPDIEEFIRVKQDHEQKRLKNFNISVAVTDEFMRSLKHGDMFQLRFGGRVYKEIDPRVLWNEIMHSNWEHAEPGVLFIDTINRENNLSYCETIAATNPCGEQPLPPFGACLLGSFNLVKYLIPVDEGYSFDWKQLRLDIPPVVRAMDNIIDHTTYPLPEQEDEAQAKRRMGLGVTGLANAGEAQGWNYGTKEFIDFEKRVLTTIRDGCYSTGVELSREKGSFPAYRESKYLSGPFVKRLPKRIRDAISKHGIRNSHYTSIAPTGTISLCADNITSGIEPVFLYSVDRTLRTEYGEQIVQLEDYGISRLGIRGKTSEDLSPDEHLNVLLAAVPLVDSAISKTINVGGDTTFEEFKDIYLGAWKGGAKGCTTFRPAGKRVGIIRAPEASDNDGAACFIDPATGTRTCE